ncbi:MAG TPA: RNA methyltransferase [Rhodocyclaceae bacterium]|nr:RNA methyltransferase [Rhodocyclaceae bacterium]
MKNDVRVRHVASRDNPVFKRLRALREGNREGRKSGLALLEGPHLLAVAIAGGHRPELLAVRETWAEDEEVRGLVKSADCAEVVSLDERLFKAISDLASPASMLAAVPIPAPAQALDARGCVVIDGLQDPGNAGTILRSAAAAGIGQALFSSGTVAAWSPRVLRAAQGAHFSLRILETEDLEGTLSAYPGKVIATVARGGRPPWALDLRGPVAWVFGNEGAGLPQQTIDLADALVTLPMSGETESINVAAAAAVCFFEAVRQVGDEK